MRAILQSSGTGARRGGAAHGLGGLVACVHASSAYKRDTFNLCTESADVLKAVFSSKRSSVLFKEDTAFKTSALSVQRLKMSGHGRSTLYST